MKERQDRFGGSTAAENGTDMMGDDLDMRDFGEDLNQLLDNYEDFVNNGDSKLKKTLGTEPEEEIIKDEDEDWVFSPVKNKKYSQDGMVKSANYGTAPNRKPTTAD